MFNRIYRYTERFGVINSNQHGFRKKHSTIDALAESTEKIGLNHRKKEDVVSVFLDLKKAFDTIEYDILLYKLEKTGIRGKGLDWIKSYVTNRKKQVVENGYQSTWQDSFWCTTAVDFGCAAILFYSILTMYHYFVNRLM